MVNQDDSLEQIESTTVPTQLDLVIDLQLNSSVIDILKILIKEEDISNDNAVINLIESNLADEEGFYPLLMTLQNQVN